MSRVTSTPCSYIKHTPSETSDACPTPHLDRSHYGRVACRPVDFNGRGTWDGRTACWLPSTLALMEELRKHGLNSRASQHKVYLWEGRRRCRKTFEADACSTPLDFILSQF